MTYRKQCIVGVFINLLSVVFFLFTPIPETSIIHISSAIVLLLLAATSPKESLS